MSDLVDQINKLEAKAQALKEAVSNIKHSCPNLSILSFSENMLMLSKSSTS